MPTVSVFTTVFASLAKSEAEVLGLKDFRLVTVRHPLDSMSPADVTAAANAVADEVVRGLVGDRGMSGEGRHPLTGPENGDVGS